jgi:hypothetical protein
VGLTTLTSLFKEIKRFEAVSVVHGGNLQENERNHTRIQGFEDIRRFKGVKTLGTEGFWKKLKDDGRLWRTNK